MHGDVPIGLVWQGWHCECRGDQQGINANKRIAKWRRKERRKECLWTGGYKTRCSITTHVTVTAEIQLVKMSQGYEEKKTMPHISPRPSWKPNRRAPPKVRAAPLLKCLTLRIPVSVSLSFFLLPFSFFLPPLFYFWLNFCLYFLFACFRLSIITLCLLFNDANLMSIWAGTEVWWYPTLYDLNMSAPL